MNIKYGLDTLQTVIYTNSVDFSDKLKIAQELTKIKTIKFTGEPTILPLPINAPLEIPRIILKTDDEKYNLNSSPSRTDLIFHEKSTDKAGIPTILTKDASSLLINATVDIFETIKSFTANVSRAAVVVKLIVKFDKSAKEFLQENLLKKMENNPYEVNLGLLFKEKLESFKINKWHRFITLRNNKNPADDSALQFSIDINTLTEVDYKFSTDKIKDFYHKAMREISKDMANYFVDKNK